MKKLLMVKFLIVLVLLFGCSNGGSNDGESAEASNSNFPDKPIELIVPYAPGGSTDATARVIAKEISNHLPNEETLVVNNVPGGSSTIGISRLYNSEPDGYTIGLVMATGLGIKLHDTELDYNWDSFTELTTLASAPQVLFVDNEAPWDTFEEWLDYVKENPGDFKYSVPGNGTSSHLMMEYLQETLDLDIVPVAYDGGGPSIQALLSGEVGGSVGFAGNGDPSQMKMLVNLSSTESSLYDVPTLADVGYAPEDGSDLVHFIGVVAPPGLDEEKKEILIKAFHETLKDPEVMEQLERQGVESFVSSEEEFKKLIKDSYDSYGDLMKRIGLVD